LVSRSIDAHAAHHTHTGAPVFVDIEAIDLDIRGDGLRERAKRRMETQGRRNQVDQRRLFANLPVAKQPSAGKVTSSAMRFDTPPVICALQDVLAIFRFYSVEEIDFDVDLRELQGQERLDVFCDFLTVIGRRLGKPVVMYCEGGAPSHPVLGFDVESDQVVLLAKPLVS